MRSSYSSKDVTILLKDVTGKLEALDTKERERRIQSGVHYSEMLPLEYRPTQDYLSLYREALRVHGERTASAVKAVAEKIMTYKEGTPVLVSLARAGTPVGILIKRYLEKRYRIQVPHYTISIIRGRGLDRNAMDYILERHCAEKIQFVDGWIGKGAIIKELRSEVEQYPGVSGELAVLADPARKTALYGTSEDFLIPSACLNATVSGLFSRTILNKDITGPEDFHGAVYFEELEKEDVSNEFLDTIEGFFETADVLCEEGLNAPEVREAERIQKDFGISDINFIKPGIGETTRVLLRRVPWRILVRDLKEEDYIGHIKRLCLEKDVELVEYPLEHYRAVGIIKNMNADI